jgi:hypothetical protein
MIITHKQITLKLQPDQENSLKKLLSNVVLYKETYEEIYDHVLTALEGYTEIKNLHQEAYHILKHDFGGYTGIANMETNRRNLIRADIRSKYLDYVKANIQNPLVIILLMAFAIGYYLVGSVYKEFSVIQIISGLISAFTPWIFFEMAKQIRTFKTTELKDPIALAALKFDVSLPALWYLLFVVSSFLIRQYFWNHGFRLAERITDSINAMLFVMILFNVYLFFNIYYRKLKNSMN